MCLHPPTAYTTMTLIKRQPVGQHCSDKLVSEMDETVTKIMPPTDQTVAYEVVSTNLN